MCVISVRVLSNKAVIDRDASLLNKAFRVEIEDAAARPCELVQVLGGDLDDMQRQETEPRQELNSHLLLSSGSVAEEITNGGGGLERSREVDELEEAATAPRPSASSAPSMTCAPRAAVVACVVSLAHNTRWPRLSY